MPSATFSFRPVVLGVVPLSRRPSISYPKLRTVLGPCLAPVVEPRVRDIRVAEPFLDLGYVGFVR
jgi:hypothetical protein